MKIPLSLAITALAVAPAFAQLAAGVLREQFTVTDTPYREVCQGCPAEGGLCSWPLAMTRRQAPETLF